jgi:Tol biopolymer transport system component
MQRAVLAGALVALGACNAERILAVATSDVTGSDGGGNASGASGSTGGAGGNASGAAGTSGTSGTSGTAGQSWTPFGTPQLIAGLRSDTDDIQDPSLTFEELEIYFTSPTGGINDIWVSTRTVASDPWGPSTLVAELSSPQNDEDPEVSVDGLTMYLTSDRGGNGRRLYMSQRRTRDTPWGMPALVAGLGTSTLDEAPTLDRSQLHFAFASQRGTASTTHLFAATRPDASAMWQAVVELSALNSAWQDSDPALFSDGAGLLFASRRLTQGGTTDLFQAARADASSPFASLAPIAELNTAAAEEDPWMSQDGKHIVFVSDRNGHSRIYEAWR